MLAAKHHRKKPIEIPRPGCGRHQEQDETGETPVALSGHEAMLAAAMKRGMVRRG